MIRALFALLGAAISLGSSYATAYWTVHAPADKPAETTAGSVEQKKLRVITIPILAGGHVDGYVIAQFMYAADAKALKALPASPDPLILDEAFRMIYGEEKLDFRNLKKLDFARIATELRKRVAQRMKSDVVKEIFLQDFNYVSKDEIRK